MNKRGKLVVVSGPSGAGKGTILNEVLKSPDFVYSVSATTRAPREGEVNGKHYFFISKEEFEERIAEGGFVEYAQYNGNYYGTPKDFVEKSIALGKNVLLEIEVQGAMQIKESVPEALFIFMTPESRDELEKRLRDRATENEETIAKRLAIADKEVPSALLYDFVVLNRHGRQDEAVSDFFAAVRASSLTPKSQYSQLSTYFYGK